jgi:hypothetical protein
MIQSVLIDPAIGKVLDIEMNAIGIKTLGVITDKAAFGQFTSALRTTAGTSTIISPAKNGAIVLTDIIISTDKVSSSTLLVRFYDGTYAVNIFYGAANDAPINITIPFAGRWRGWRNAWIEMTTVASLTAIVAIGYFKVNEGIAQDYTDWNAGR